MDIHVFIVCVFYDEQLINSAAFFIFQKENGNKKPVKRAQKNKENKNSMKKPGETDSFLLIYFSFYINI